MNPSALASHLRGKLVPAVPVPFSSDGVLARDAQRSYARWMAAQPVAGVAIWAHTGRGLHLTREQRAIVLADWRDALLPGSVIVAGCGIPRGEAQLPSDPTRRALEVISRTLAMAGEARDGGAHALLVHPPAAFSGLPDGPRRVLELHEALAECGLPLIAFLLYERASGMEYDDSTIDALLVLPHVIGLKIATLDSVVRVQDVADRMRRLHPGKLLVTGEDRFLGYSLQLGAHCALIGMGAACTAAQSALVSAAVSDDAASFLRLSRACDSFAASTFVHPMDGYVQRMLWALVADGVIPESACHDPFGPPLDPAERAVVARAVRAMRDAGR